MAMRASDNISRRQVLNTALVTTLGTVMRCDPALAQQLQTHRAPGIPPKPKGPLVFLDYDQEELDDSYTQSLWAPNQTELDKRNRQKSEQAIVRLGPPRRLAYGPTEIEKLDWYPTKAASAPIHFLAW